MQKFIVTDEGSFRYGDVALHKHLLQPGESCIGGGTYYFEPSLGRMMLEGRSYDFGRVKWTWISELLLPAELAGLDIRYEDIPLSDFVTLRFLQPD